MPHDTSVKRDLWIVLATLLLFMGLIPAATWLNDRLNLPQAFNIVGAAAIAFRVALSSALVFLLFRLVFKNTLGKDFGRTFDAGWNGFATAEKARWIIGAFLVLFFAIFGAGEAKGQSLPVSEKARDLIIYYEVGGRSYYESRLSTPTVPAWQNTASGVTVGFGVDVGHMSKEQIADAFTGVIPAAQIKALQAVSGKKGADAYYNGLPQVKYLVRIDWSQATKVFEKDTLPRFSAMTAKAFVIAPKRLHADQNGALVSIVFNRGSSMTGSSRAEMRQIRDDIASHNDHFIPARITSMKRLWVGKGLTGLLKRRDAEAALFNAAL